MDLVKKVLILVGRWDSMRSRVRGRFDKSHDQSYVNRNIKIHAIWQRSKGRENFIRWALANGFDQKLDLERINNNLGYSPGNCRWATRSENIRNTSKSVFVRYKGNKINMKTLSEHPDCVVSYPCLKGRIKAGWKVKEAVTIPKHHGNGWWSGPWQKL